MDEAQELKDAAAHIRAVAKAVAALSGTGLGGAVTRWCEIFEPDRMADALVAWLESAATEAEQVGPNHYAVAVARVVNQEQIP